MFFDDKNIDEVKNALIETEILYKTSFYPKPDSGNNTFQELLDNLNKNLEH